MHDAGLLTAAQLGLLEATQGLGVQGFGVGTERTLRQLQGVVPGPGQQPAQAAVTRQELGAQVPAEWAEGPRSRAGGVWAHRAGMEPQGKTEAGHQYVCTTRGLAVVAEQVWWSDSRSDGWLWWLPCLCVCPWAEEGSRGPRPWAGRRYSHSLQDWQLIKDSWLQTGEDVSRYVSAGGREQ